MTKKLFEIVVSNSNSSYPVQYDQTQHLNHNLKMLLQIWTHVKPLQQDKKNTSYSVLLQAAAMQHYRT